MKRVFMISLSLFADERRSFNSLKREFLKCLDKEANDDRTLQSNKLNETLTLPPKNTVLGTNSALGLLFILLYSVITCSRFSVCLLYSCIRFTYKY